MSTDPQKNDLDQTLSATTDIDSLLQGTAPMDDMFPSPDLGSPPGGMLGGDAANETMEAQPASIEGEHAAEEVEPVTEEEVEKKPGRMAVLLEQFDIYTSLLLISLLAMFLGCLFLWIEWGRYGRDTKAKTAGTHARVGMSSPWDRPATHV